MDRPPLSAPNPSPEGASLVHFLLILRRRWRLLAIVWSVTVAATAIYTFSIKKLYRPQASLEIRPETPLVSMSDVNDPSFLASRTNYENYYRTQEQILTSPTLLEKTLGRLPEAIRREFDGKADPLKAFSDKLEIEKVRTSFILKVGFVDESPDTAMQVVNTLVSLYLEDANLRLRELKSGAMEVLSKEALPSMRTKVEDADQKLQEFLKKSGFMDFEEHYKLLIEKYRKFDTTLTDLGLRKRKLRAELDALGSYGMDGVSGLFNPAFHSTRSLEPLAEHRSKVAGELAKQEKMLKEKHPLVVELRAEHQLVDEKIREAVRGTLRALETDLAQVEAEEKGVKEDQAEVLKLMEEVGGRKFRFRQLEGELAGAKDLYSSYLKKHGETTATSGATLGSVRIVDHAVLPLVSYKPKVGVNLGIAGIVGLLLGIGAILVIEQLDDRIQSPREVEAFVGVDVLAMIPKLSSASATGAGPILLDEESGLPEFEAFRGLRAELVTRLEKLEGSKLVCILSALQSEGKSTVTANLAKVLALEGRRVLVFDADMRRPSQLTLIGVEPRLGLEEVLRGTATVQQAVTRSRISGVDVLGANKATSGAAELAGTPRFEQAVKWAREHYDFVLIDSAPVNQVSESALVARRADATLMVIREGHTGRGAAITAVRRLLGMEVKLAGVVLNCALPHGRGYGYSYYSYYRQETSR